ncbi:hypothetical protein [Actinotalea fermentans]|uniref:Lipoprotein n=1 Tax=Actinotalea fermentans TaxID=43671 RepID=A0A511YZB4_9CELL|nr:hypothetical protein [Actinotalea fermentans]KGM15293.1 hypothetical protein N867_10130 [Actinotalea fermentans ATCC 43279 = JCM 9966 = DSM 3133]GEN80540.1 hypothetical protein AFE02nite_22740 [Actinotalea fermentans]
MRTMRTGALVGVLVGVLALSLAGCQTGRADDGGAGAGGGAGTEGGGDADVPDVTGDGATLVLQLHAAGGFVPWGYDFASVPALSVYADGTAIVHGPMTMEYPGKALPNLQVVQLPDGTVQEIVAAAAEADLLAPGPDYGMPGVADLPTTRVTIAVGGQTYEHEAYALGAGPGETTPEDEGMFGGGDTGLTEEQSAARVTLAQFIQRVNGLVGATGAEESYAIPALGVMAMPVDPATDQGVEGVDIQVLAWPVGVALADAGQCALVEGADAQTLLATLAEANQLTQFEQDGVTYQAWFRPLLPHETSCADLIG